MPQNNASESKGARLAILAISLYGRGILSIPCQSQWHEPVVACPWVHVRGTAQIALSPECVQHKQRLEKIRLSGFTCPTASTPIKPIVHDTALCVTNTKRVKRKRVQSRHLIPDATLTLLERTEHTALNWLHCTVEFWLAKHGAVCSDWPRYIKNRAGGVNFWTWLSFLIFFI